MVLNRTLILLSLFAERPKRYWVKISQIRILSVERIGKKIGVAIPEELALVIEGLNEIT